MIEVRIDSPEDIESRLTGFGNRLRMMWSGDVSMTVSARPYQDVRSRAQNNLYWRWLSILSSELSTGAASYSKDDLHDLLRHKFLGTEEVAIAGEVITRLPSTTKLQRGNMATYMQRIEQWAADLSVLLPVPADNEYAKYREAMQ